jgi:hypothetical protein
MKPQTFFRLALLFPYALWVVCALVFFLLSRLEIPEAWNIALMPVTFYVFGIILWFIPYTVLAVGLWFWSKNRPITTLRNAALVSPLLFLVLMLIETVLVSLPADSVAEFIQELLGQAVMLGVFSLVFGYLCVGIALGLFKFLQARNLIAQETPPPLSVG